MGFQHGKTVAYKRVLFPWSPIISPLGLKLGLRKTASPTVPHGGFAGRTRGRLCSPAMKTLRLAATLALIAGCAQQPRLIDASPRMAVVNVAFVIGGDATGVAEAHCMKYGLHAQRRGRQGPNLYYDCVP